MKGALCVNSWLAALLLGSACVTPGPKPPEETPMEPLPAVAPGPTRPSPEVLRLIDRMAAQVDMLQLARTDLVSFDGHVDRDERQQWAENVADFRTELRQFVHEHPTLDATERARLERRVVAPLQVIAGAPR